MKPNTQGLWLPLAEAFSKALTRALCATDEEAREILRPTVFALYEWVSEGRLPRKPSRRRPKLRLVEDADAPN